jgi:hypothetical protein
MEWKLILAAMATSTGLHAAMEPDNIMRKLRRLNNVINTGKIDSLPMKGIDTRPKAYAVGVAFLVIPTAIFYTIAKAIDPSANSAMKYSIVVMLLSAIILTFKVDKYHVEIEKMTKLHRRK